MTRYTAATGKILDASTFGGSPGQLAWVMREDGKASAGVPRAESGIYVCPDPNGVNGSWIRLWGSGTLLLTNKYHVAQDTHIRSLLACVAQETHPRGAILDPDPEGYSNGLARLLRSYVEPSTLHTTCIAHDPLTGEPTRLLTYVPSLLPDGTYEMARADRQPDGTLALSPPPVRPLPPPPYPNPGVYEL
jgi:hypothetical protein